MQAGMAHHGAGRAAQAEALYRQALDIRPNHPDALHLLGILALQAGQPAVAAGLIGQAIGVDAGNPIFFSNLAITLRRLGRREDAAAVCRRALALAPDFPDALSNLSNILCDQGDHGRTAAALQRLLRLNPLLSEQRLQLGHALLLDGRPEEAVEAFMTLLGIQPASVAGYTNLGVALRRLGRLDEAVAAYRSALGFSPGEPGTLNNLGIALQERGAYAQAVSCFHHAIAVTPEDASAHLNLSLVARDEMRVDASIALARRAVQLDPMQAEGHTALGFGLLLQGRLEEGFADYEWRSRMADFPSPRRGFASPVWDGSDLSGRTLLIHDEQGVGDTMMLARYAPLLQSRGVRVYLECNSQLVRLLSSMPGIEGVIGRFQQPPPHDAHVALASVPHRLGTTLYTIPAEVPYLRAEPALVTAWRGRLFPTESGRLRVGLVWAGNPDFKGDRLRSPGLAAFRPLLDVAGVEFYGLQKGPGRRDLEQAGPLPASFTDLGAAIGDFADTAAIMEQLDLVVSSCTGPAHLAGALGRPVWTVLPFAPDWRWLEHGVCTPWYPTMRLFRQERPGDWTGVLRRVRTALAALARDKAQGVRTRA
nr:tetratricopeptide repeat protein [Azospirillum sp. A1-3]